MIVLVNQALGIPAGYLTYNLWWSRQSPEYARDIRILPDMWKTFGYLTVSMICHDFLFYHLHRFSS